MVILIVCTYIHMCMYVYVCVCVCVFVCMRAWHVSMYVCVHVCDVCMCYYAWKEGTNFVIRMQLYIFTTVALFA